MKLASILDDAIILFISVSKKYFLDIYFFFSAVFLFLSSLVILRVSNWKGCEVGGCGLGIKLMVDWRDFLGAFNSSRAAAYNELSHCQLQRFARSFSLYSTEIGALKHLTANSSSTSDSDTCSSSSFVVMLSPYIFCDSALLSASLLRVV